MFFHELSGLADLQCFVSWMHFNGVVPHDSHFREAREGHMERQLTKPSDNSRKKTRSVRAAGSEANVFFLCEIGFSEAYLCELLFI